jgi:hypothetical protein
MTTFVITRNDVEYDIVDAEDIDAAVEEAVRILKSDWTYLQEMLRENYGRLTEDTPLTFDPDNEDTIGDEIFIASTVDEEDSVGFFFYSAECMIEQLLQQGEVLFETGDEISGEIVAQITSPGVCWDHPVFVIEKRGLSRVVYHPVPEKVEKTECPQTLFFSRRNVEYFGFLRPAQGGPLLTIVRAVPKVLETEHMHEVYDYDN